MNTRTQVIPIHTQNNTIAIFFKEMKYQNMHFNKDLTLAAKPTWIRNSAVCDDLCEKYSK